MKIDSLDHLVLTVEDIATTVRFYTEILGMEREVFGDGRIALRYGEQKINLHQAGKEFEPKAAHPTPGSADLCFVTRTPLEEAVAELAAKGVTLVDGPGARTGALGPLLSVYLRDPDRNLIEISNYRVTGDGGH